MESEEGWGNLRPGDRVFHYYRGGMSLCRRIMLYNGPLYPDEGSIPTADDCTPCTRKLRKEQAKAKSDL